MVAPTPITTSSVPPPAALSRLTARVIGLLMGLAITTTVTTRTRDAGTTSTPRVPLTTDTAARTPTTTSSARHLVAALSLWTVLDLGVGMDLAITTTVTTRTRGASTTR